MDCLFWPGQWEGGERGGGLEVASAPGGRLPSPWLSDMPFGQSPLTVRASTPAARTREAWKSLEAGSRELGCLTLGPGSCSGEYLRPQTDCPDQCWPEAGSLKCN